MNIEQLFERHKKLERDLAQSISTLLREFTDECGLSPSAVSVSMIESTNLADTRKRYEVASVEAHVEP